jgi:chromosome transmission fidelity protein 1
VSCWFVHSNPLIPDLIPTLLSLSTCTLTASTLALSFQQVCDYVSKFRNRLNPANLLQLKRLVIFLDALKKFVVEWRDLKEGERSVNSLQSGQQAEVFTVTQMMDKMGKRAAAINLLEIEAYLKRSKVGDLLHPDSPNC